MIDHADLIRQIMASADALGGPAENGAAFTLLEAAAAITALVAERDAAYAALRQAARTIPTAWSWHESHAAAISRATQAVPKG